MALTKERRDSLPLSGPKSLQFLLLSCLALPPIGLRMRGGEDVTQNLHAMPRFCLSSAARSGYLILMSVDSRAHRRNRLCPRNCNRSLCSRFFRF